MGRKELALRTGCHPETVRYYERVGLLPAPPRSPGGHRRYGPAHERRLRLVLACRRLGFTLAEIRLVLDACDGGGALCPTVRARLGRKLGEVRAELAHLMRVAAALEELLGCCGDGSEEECPALGALTSGTSLPHRMAAPRPSTEPSAAGACAPVRALP